MSLPYFYISAYKEEQAEQDLDEDNARHIVQVLRMKAGEDLLLADGRGHLLTASIREAGKKKCRVEIKAAAYFPPAEKRVAIALPPLKNTSRFEWFLEKATEIGVSEIIPLMTARTERQHLRPDRLLHILVSALLQSQQVWLPVLRTPTTFSSLLDAPGYDRRLIALLSDGATFPYPRPDSGSALILIGPEGDFTPEEAAAARDRQFIPVTLGTNRLRTETAGVVAATLLCIG